jgi:ABC-type protease/lipase transport system fused ATPase/permease subunit
MMAPTLLVCVLLSLAVQATMLTAPLLTMHVFDGVLESRNLGTLWVLSAAFLAALLLGGLLQYLRAALLAALAERVGRRLQLRALAASVRVALGGERAAAGRALQDVAELRRMLGGSVPADVLDLLSIPLALGFLWMLHPLFFAVALVAGLVQGAIGLLADRATRGATAAASLNEARSRRGLVQQLALREMVVGLGMMPAALARFAPRQALAMQRRGQAERSARALSGLLELAVFAQQGAIVGAGVWLLLEHQISPGSMLAAATLVTFATRPVVHLVGHWRDWSEGFAASGRLAELVRRGAPPDAILPVTDAPPGLVVEGLTLRAPGGVRPLVEALDLALPPGGALVLAGANGAGKTTLIRALLGLTEPAAGRVLLDGQDTRRASRTDIAPLVGYLPQEAQLLDGSILENINRFGEGSAGDAVAAARRVGAHEAIGRLPRGYESAGGPDAGLSGGQARLIALARAFHGAPRLIVLDEPEAGLDGAARAGVRACVAAARAQGCAVVLVSHDPAAWRGVVDTVLRLTGSGPWTLEPAA